MFGIGEQITYTTTVTNAGPDPAPDVTVTDPLPDGTAFLSASASQGSCSEAGELVTCDLGTIGVNGTATITLVVETIAITYENTATASSSGVDADGASGTSPTVAAAASDIPAFSEWTLILLGLILAATGFVVVRRP